MFSERERERERTAYTESRVLLITTNLLSNLREIRFQTVKRT